MGKYTAPGLPNLTGYSATAAYWSKSVTPPNGVFTISNRLDYAFSPIPEGSEATSYSLNFAANSGNAIYGASSTVMPASVDITVGLYLGCPAEV